MLERDRLRFRFAAGNAAASPLGAGALAGSTLPLPVPANQLRNSLDAVADRDFVEGIRVALLGTVALLSVALLVGWRLLTLDRGARTVRFTRPGMRIDLGGFAKGYAVDNAARILRAHGIRHAMVSAGGDSRVIGDRRGRPWTIGVRDPRRPGEVVALLPLEDVAVSTSGDYERFFEADGVRCHQRELWWLCGQAARTATS
jgi:hypothetical protein